MRYVFVLVLAGGMIVGTWLAGWMTVPIAAAVYAMVRRDARAPRDAAVAAVMAWGLLLLSLARLPTFATLLTQLGQIFPVPGVAVAALALLLAVVLAASAARFVIGVVGLRENA